MHKPFVKFNIHIMVILYPNNRISLRIQPALDERGLLPLRCSTLSYNRSGYQSGHRIILHSVLLDIYRDSVANSGSICINLCLTNIEHVLYSSGNFSARRFSNLQALTKIIEILPIYNLAPIKSQHKVTSFFNLHLFKYNTNVYLLAGMVFHAL